MRKLLVMLLAVPVLGCGNGADPVAIKPGTETPTEVGDQQLSENAARMKAMGEQMQQQQAGQPR